MPTKMNGIENSINQYLAVLIKLILFYKRIIGQQFQT